MNNLTEASRKDLINKGKKSDTYRDTSKGRNRFERRKYSKISTSVSQYNNIDMNSFFKKDILTVGITVKGETNDYTVKVKFGNILQTIQQNIKANNNKLEFKTIVTSLSKVFNYGDVYIHCDCPDFTYRQAYWATKNNYNSGTPETRASNITNPRDTKGSGCKHVMLILSNIDWMMKIASVINNYIHYAEEHMEKAFADIIFPKLYGVKYDKAIQLGLFDKDDLESDQSLIDIINDYGKHRTQFKKDKIVNNQKTFTKKDKPNKDQLSLPLDD